MEMKNIMSFCLTAVATVLLTLPLVSCDNTDNATETVAPQPSSETLLYAYGIEPTGTRAAETDDANVLFTEDDIEWLDLKTREFKFRETDVPLYKKLGHFQKFEIRLGDEVLFQVSSVVRLIDSAIYDDLILCYGNQEDTSTSGYYFYDCYPLQFLNTERVQANKKKNEAQWDAFVKYLDSKGKIKR